MRDTTGRIKIIPITKGTNTRFAKVTGKQGVVAYTSGKSIYYCQIDEDVQIAVPGSRVCETIKPDMMKDYVASMLANGWTIKKGISSFIADLLG